jgi:AraC family transcriptional regulator
VEHDIMIRHGIHQVTTRESEPLMTFRHQDGPRPPLLDFMPLGPATNRTALVGRDTPNERTSSNMGFIARCERGIRLRGARPTPRTDGFTICIDLYGSAAHPASFDEFTFIAPARHPGEVTIYDRRYRWRFDLPEALDCVLFHLPRALFERMAGSAAFDWSSTAPGLFSGGRPDETLKYLAMATWLSFDSALGTSTAFANHLTASVMLHLTQRYGVAQSIAQSRGGLGPWREALVRDLAGLHLHEPLPLASLAKACGLSTSHFAREFKTSFGCSPHRWLRLQRLERAKTLMRTTTETLSDIAVAAGFADQSHMTRIFSRHENVSPAAWRRNSAHPSIGSKALGSSRTAALTTGRQAPAAT